MVEFHNFFFQFTASYEADPSGFGFFVGGVVFQFTASYEADPFGDGVLQNRIDLSIHSLIRG